MQGDRKSNLRRYLLKIHGVVQGVGYRPYVYNQSTYFNIKGWVSNSGSALVVDLEGDKKDIKDFLNRIVRRPPEHAIIERIELIPKALLGYKEFIIKESSMDESGYRFIANDVAICPECLNDMLNPSNPRYNYPFTNCTSCGPRYSIIQRLPYDRINTTMKSFAMCPTCEEEYNDSTNRRFHAQTNCCPNCGPSLKLLNSKGGEVLCKDAIEDTINLIKQGNIVAIKGIGGFHLACDAENERAIEGLRRRKKRPHKPLAVMVKDSQTAKKLAYISEEEERVLSGNKRPIVLLNKKNPSILPDIVAPNTNKIGIFLPYTPLHYLLFQKDISMLVMTSGNISGGPIQYEDEGIVYLKDIADYFLIHNREINTPVEDSVVKLIDGHEMVIRSARGYTPYTINMNANHDILALGSEQKSTFSMSKNGYVYMSQYFGDLNDFDAFINYEKGLDNVMNLLDVRPRIVTYDLHSKTVYSQLKENKFDKEIPVQHHHAHMASCMVEHKLFDKVIGVVFDGTGLGTDGTIWGGEFFLGTRKDFIRVGHLKYVTVQGNDQAIKEPWRIGFSYLHAMNVDIETVYGKMDEEGDLAIQSLEKSMNCFQTSSMGRFFDGVASLLNIRHKITYDAQGAIELENSLDTYIKESYDYDITEKDGMYEIDYERIITGVLQDKEMGIALSTISAKFHNTVGNFTVDLVCKMSNRYGIKQVVLSGGVFQNNYLLLYVCKELRKCHFNVYYNQQIPINDSGISVGQLAIADAIEGERYNVHSSSR